MDDASSDDEHQDTHTGLGSTRTTKRPPSAGSARAPKRQGACVNTLGIRFHALQSWFTLRASESHAYGPSGADAATASAPSVRPLSLSLEQAERDLAGSDPPPSPAARVTFSPKDLGLGVLACHRCPADGGVFFTTEGRKYSPWVQCVLCLQPSHLNCETARLQEVRRSETHDTWCMPCVISACSGVSTTRTRRGCVRPADTPSTS